MTLGLAFVLVFWAAVFYTLGVFRVLGPSDTGRRAIRIGKWQIRAAGRWDKHPCRMPVDPPTMTAANSIWQCHCGRRWKFLERKNSDEYPYSRINYWEERTPEKDLADAQAELKKLELEERTRPGAITRSARKRIDSGTGRERLSEVARSEAEHGRMAKGSNPPPGTPGGGNW